MLALIASCLLAQIEVSPVQRIHLDNGAQAVVTTLPEARTTSVQLLLSSPDVDAKNVGFRHLLEHLFLGGADGKLEDRLEATGCLLEAETTRDMLAVEINGPPGRLSQIVAAVAELVKPRTPSAERIASELAVHCQELALRMNSHLLSSAAWSAAFEAEGIDPFGDLGSMGQATPDALAELHAKLVEAPRVVISVAGPSSAKEAMDLVRPVLLSLRRGERAVPAVRPSFPSRRVSASGANAASLARSLWVPGLADASTLVVLAAALGIREATGGEAIYTPSAWSGLLTIAFERPEQAASLESMSDYEVRQAAVLGVLSMSNYLKTMLSVPAAAARLRGTILLQRPGFDPDRLHGLASTVGILEVDAAIQRFRARPDVLARGAGNAR